MPISIAIAGMTFTSKEAFIDHCRAILYRSPLETEIVGDDREFVDAILHARPDKLAEMAGRRPVRYLRKMHRHNTPSFFVELDDGRLLDFSFMKFVNAYPRPTAA
ncbi:DUF3223 domain-containing protein [Mesorhizobium sp. YM1C-6-2]|uniref:DUF3223 domain-containing protein n=1 Tax=Mesorhizobium sp. YM1C-6-2 TaxID=1827501 RepID=UPI000EF232AB|nr:DUF3223 domain-containing protein [Mesorhizobium sp. YM1C-6-2]RLP25783.1 DUF3223 domain-containing protein [Mesorhizobium sp. YM1C-6-2]